MKSLSGLTMSLTLGLSLALGGVAFAQKAGTALCCAMASCCCKGDSCPLKGEASCCKGKQAAEKKDGCCGGDSCDLKQHKQNPGQ